VNSFFAVRPFPFLKKEDNEEKHKLFLGTNVFSRYTITTTPSSDQSSHEPAARGNGFQLSGSNTQREKKWKYQTNSAQVSYKLSQKNYLLNLSLKRFISVKAKLRLSVMDEAVCSSAKKIESEGWS